MAKKIVSEDVIVTSTSPYRLMGKKAGIIKKSWGYTPSEEEISIQMPSLSNSDDPDELIVSEGDTIRITVEVIETKDESELRLRKSKYCSYCNREF